MAKKYITQLTGTTSPSLTGHTVYDNGSTTNKVTLRTLRQTLVDSGSHYFTGSQYISGDLTISGSLTDIKSTITNVTGSVNLSTIMTLSKQSTLPTGTTGSLAVSGSGLYFHNGTSWNLIS
jgi:hypothetical protein